MNMENTEQILSAIECKVFIRACKDKIAIFEIVQMNGDEAREGKLGEWSPTNGLEITDDQPIWRLLSDQRKSDLIHECVKMYVSSKSTNK